MTVMRTSGGKRGTIVKRELWSTLSKLDRCFKRVYLSPKLDDFKFLLWKIKLGSDFDCKSDRARYGYNTWKRGGYEL